MTWFFAALLLIGLYYLSYRYPFQINSSLSSPTYKDTPTWLQMGKYVLIALVLAGCVLVGVLNGRSRALISPATPGLRTVFLLLGGFAFAKGVTVGSIDMLTFSFSLIVGFFVCGWCPKWAVDSRILTRILIAFSIVAVVVDAVQVYLFQTTGRLPALAYAQSVSVRFGSVLDDPNGYSILVALLIPVVATGWRNHKVWRAVVVLALAGSLFLTQSFTGATATTLSLFLGYFFLRWRNPLTVAGFFLLMPVAAFLGWKMLTSPATQELLITKAGSIAAHATALDALKSLSVQDMLGLGVSTAGIDSSYISLISRFGLLFAILYLAIGLSAVVRLHRNIRLRGGEGTQLHYGFYFFLIAYLIGGVNMQFTQVFPLDLFYVAGITFSLFASKDSQQGPVRMGEQPLTVDGRSTPRGRGQNTASLRPRGTLR